MRSFQLTLVQSLMLTGMTAEINKAGVGQDNGFTPSKVRSRAGRSGLACWLWWSFGSAISPRSLSSQHSFILTLRRQLLLPFLPIAIRALYAPVSTEKASRYCDVRLASIGLSICTRNRTCRSFDALLSKVYNVRVSLEVSEQGKGLAAAGDSSDTLLADYYMLNALEIASRRTVGLLQLAAGEI